MDWRFWIPLMAVHAGCVVAVDDGFCVDEPLEGVVLELDNGDVRVESSDQLCVGVELGGLGSNGIGHRVEDGVLILDYACDGLCGGEITVEAPPQLFVDVELGAGDLELDARDGDVWARVGAGELTADRMRSEYAELLVGSGDLVATFETAPLGLAGLVAAGNLELEVPEGGYRLEVTADAGSIELDGVFDDPDAEGAIHAEGSAGSVAIRGRPALDRSDR